MKIGESIECLPFGEITLKEIREDKPKRADMYVKVYMENSIWTNNFLEENREKKH